MKNGQQNMKNYISMYECVPMPMYADKIIK